MTAAPRGQVRRRRIVGHGGVSLAAVEVGPPDAPAWLIAHGAGSSARFVLEAFAGPVLATGARLVTYDLRGHGASGAVTDPQAHHLDVQAADLLAVADTVAGVTEVVGGVSLGAHAAVRALAGPGSGGSADVGVALACLPAWTGAAVAGTGPHAGSAAEVRTVGVPAVVERLRAVEGLPGWLRETLVTDYPRHHPASLAATLEALDGGDAPGEDELRALRVPLAVVGWPDDPGHPLAVAERWAGLGSPSAIGRSRLQDLEGDVAALGRCAVDVVLRCRARP